jgi:eukaryotic-like serine/threonine-protein kinase
MFDLARGTALGQYVILERLGQGGAATVYRARQPSLDREVAIKVLSPTLAEAPGFLQRFRHEAHAVSRLRHPNILTVHDFGTQDGMTYMVTEYLPGGTLAERIGRPMPLETVRDIVTAVGAALDYAHASGIVHRDVKPANILFTREGVPVLSDFGIARMLERSERFTMRGSLIGTPHYMSPEQASGRDVGPASDLYSLGIVLYEMLAGQPPFSGNTSMRILYAHIHEPLPPLGARSPDAPVSLDALLQRALAKDPEVRYPSGRALGEALAAALAGSRPSVVSPAPSDDTPTPQPFPVRPARTMPLPVTPHPGAQPEPDAEAETSFVEPSRPRRRSVLGPIATILALAAVLVGAFLIARSLAQDDAPPTAPTAVAEATAPPATSAPPPTVETPKPVAPAASSPQVAAPASPPVAPTSAGSPTAGAVGGPTTGPPAAASPAAQADTPANPPPTRPPATADLTSGPLTVQILTPADGERVPARPPVRGVRTGLQGPDEHLWILFHPQGQNDFWWPYKRELIAERDGTWEVDDVEIGGPPGTRHDLVIGVASAAGHRAIVDQIRNRPDEPFEQGLPPGFRPLARVTVVKAGP